jgi:hypothetical protein
VFSIGQPTRGEPEMDRDRGKLTGSA